MILHGNQRGGGKALGLHLLNTHDNEHVDVHQVRGFVADDVIGAFKEAHAISRGTKCDQFLFSLSLSPPPDERVDVAAFENAIDQAEDRLGLNDQPRVIVFHEKEGRRHAHAVWSRIDEDTMTTRQMSFYKTRLREVSRELFLEHDWKMPAGLQNSRDADPRNFTLDEWQQAKRAGFHARDLKTAIQDAYATSDGTAAFKAALEEKGLKLAAGRRGPIAMTPSGEPLLVSKYAGKKAAEVREKIKGDLPSIDQAKAEFAKDMAGAMYGHLETVNKAHTERMAPLADERRAMTSNHRTARTRLDERLEERLMADDRQRIQELRTGLFGFWDKIRGRQAKQLADHEVARIKTLDQQQKQRDDLIAAQLLERQRLQTQIDQARKDHLRQTQNLHRDLSRFKEGDLSAFKPVDRTGGVHRQTRRKTVQQTASLKEAARASPPAPPKSEQPNRGLTAQRDTLKPAWQQAARSPQDRLEKLRNQAVEAGSVEKSREERLAAFKEQRLQVTPQRDQGPTRGR